MSNLLLKKWKVVDTDEQIEQVQDYLDDDGERATFTSTPEDISIFTVDNEEVIGCSEWMRAEKETMVYIVKLHNDSLDGGSNEK